MITIINAKTGERFRLTRSQFLRALGRCNVRSRRGILAAVKRQAAR